MKIKFYLLKHDSGKYDAYCGHVICARSHREARKMASEVAGGEGSKVWMDPKKSTCELLKEKKIEIGLSDFNAG